MMMMVILMMIVILVRWFKLSNLVLCFVRESEEVVVNEEVQINTRILSDLSIVDQSVIHNTDIHHAAFNHPSAASSHIPSSSSASSSSPFELPALTSPTLASPSLLSPSPPSYDSLPSVFKESYFGYAGRQRFFDCYRDLSREYMTTGK